LYIAFSASNTKVEMNNRYPISKKGQTEGQKVGHLLVDNKKMGQELQKNVLFGQKLGLIWTHPIAWTKTCLETFFYSDIKICSTTSRRFAQFIKRYKKSVVKP